jgi:hypothetical protein
MRWSTESDCSELEQRFEVKCVSRVCRCLNEIEGRTRRELVYGEGDMHLTRDRNRNTSRGRVGRVDSAV